MYRIAAYTLENKFIGYLIGDSGQQLRYDTHHDAQHDVRFLEKESRRIQQNIKYVIESIGGSDNGKV